jgi:signal transduction histidine kinase/DNA-binding response OmpR family regulator
VFTYLAITDSGKETLSEPAKLVLIVATVYLVYSLLMLASTYAWPRPQLFRRVANVIVDTSVLTFAMIAAGAVAAPLFGGYLWATIANGLRYGRHCLYYTNIASAIGFGLVLTLSDYWQQQIVLGGGLMLWLVVLPIYVSILLRRLEVALVKSKQASVSKSNFLANMSHELRTPLNAIIGYSEMLEEEAADRDDKQGATDLQRIQRSANHLLTLINGILDLSKIEAGKMEVHFEDASIKELIEETMAVVEPLAEKKGNRLEIDCDCDCDKDDIYTDKVKLKQALFNLLSNANKFTDNGTVRLSVRTVHDKGNPRLVFAVKDTGIGIGEDDLARLFQPFVQVDESSTRRYEGTGLGLTITKRFVEMLGGEITVSSEAGKGTEFVITFPVTNAGRSVEPPPVEQHKQRAEEKRLASAGTGERRKRVSTILVVDDDEHVRDLLGRNLTKEGFFVVSAGNGLDGIRIANKNCPDVIILDVMMPGMDGWAVLKVLKNDERTASIPVLMVSMAENAKVGIALGAADYIMKPLDMTKISAAIKKWLRRGSRQPILLCSTDAHLTDAVRVVMDKHGHNIVVHADHGNPVTTLEKYNPSLILLDLMVGDHNNIDRLNELSHAAQQKNIPVIALTADQTDSERFQKLKENVDQTIKKHQHSSEGLILDILKLVNLQLKQDADSSNQNDDSPARKSA